jgi:hypothetical protein
MKRFWLSALLLLAFAVPSLGKTTNWINAVSTDWAVAGNWSNGVPVTLDTVQFLDSTVDLPASNLPNAGEVFAIVIRDDVGAGWNKELFDFLGTGSWGYTSLAIGSAAEHDTVVTAIGRDSEIGGTVTLYAEAHSNADFNNAAITVKSGGSWQNHYVSTYTQKVIVEAGGIFTAQDGLDALLNGGIDLAGTLNTCAGIGGPGVVDSASPINVTGDATIDWGTGGNLLVVKGGLNANGFAVTHTNTTGATLICDAAGTLDLGGSAPGLHIDITAAITNGVLPLSGLTVDIGAGGSFSGAITSTADGNTIIMANGTSITGTVNITHTCTWTNTGTNTLNINAAGTLNLGTTTANTCVVNVTAATTIGGSFACGTFTNAAGGALTVSNKTITVAAGGFADAGGTCTVGELNIVCSATTAVASWPTEGDALKSLTVNSGATATTSGTVYARAVYGEGNVAISGANILYLSLIPSSNFWTLAGTVTGTGKVVIYAGANISNAAAINLANTGFLYVYGVAKTITLTGKLTSGGECLIDGLTAGNTCTLTCNGGCDFAGAVTFGGGTNHYGALTLAAGQVHTFRSTIARAGTGTANAITFGGRMNLGGNVTLAGITMDFGQSRIDATAAITINGATATGISNNSAVTSGTIVTGQRGAVTFSNMNTNWTTGHRPIFARRWVDGGGNGVRVATLAPHWATGARP